MREPELVRSMRKLCLAFPRTVERTSHGVPSWFVGEKRMFAALAHHHHDDRIACWVAAQDGVQRHLLEDDPHLFFRPPYVGARGWIGMWLDRDPEWDRVEQLVDEAWRAVAGPRLVRAYDGQR
ncbi:MmcQ/YjbR family DNA-binding protein [Dermatophilaceae bacterium Soc4.6]